MGEEATIAGPTEAAPRQRRPLRESVLAGRFFAQQHADIAGDLAAFLHGNQDPGGALETWFGERLAGLLSAGGGRLRAALDRDIAEIDAILGDQLDTILHQPRFLALEGRWRGLAWLISGIEPGRRVKIRLLPISWSELCRDLERALEFDQSLTFRKVYEEEFGMPGGEPFGLMVIDHAVRHRAVAGATTDDVSGLAQLSAVAAAAFMPTVLSLHPSVLEVDAFSDLEGVRDVTAPLRGPDHLRWRSLSGRADMRFVALTLPRLLARRPWTDEPGRLDGFRYSEYAPTAGTRVWMSAGYAFAACAVRAFVDSNWPADVRGAEIDRVGGGLVTNLPAEPFISGPPHAWPRKSIEYQFSFRQEHALVDVGLLPIGVLPFGPELVFGASRSMQAPASYSGVTAATAEANARLSAQINSMLCAARFAHLLKVMGRDMVGAFRTADEIERQLNRWLQGYVNTNIDSTGESRARFPLLEGNVQVRERAGKPGVFGCTIHLRPHYQLDDIATAFHLVTELAAPGV
ncbi:MAG: type VI secretion system contractile sheath large subunit [Proteobacteria bacterium]|nr:type VI secretion system contractile sheath large subunit [Pseudomonadota bacterium]